MSDMITLSCWIYGDKSSCPVEISREQPIILLQYAICNKKPNLFQVIDQYSLDLWKVEIPDDDEAMKQNFEFKASDILRPTRKIGTYFIRDPAKDRIHIIARPPPPTLTSEQVLSPIPLSIEYDLLSATSDPLSARAESPAHGFTPQSVEKWSAFINDARAYHFDDAIRHHRMPTFGTGHVRTKADVGRYFTRNILINLQHIASRTLSGVSNEFHPQLPIKGSGTPDHTCLENNLTLFFIEIKTKKYLDIADIVTEYNNQQMEESIRMPIIKAIRQVFGYMGDGKLRYGVLSTYDRTWFLYRPDDSPGSLLISDCVKRTATNPTLLHCFAYMMTLPRGGNHISRNPPPSPIPSPPTHDDHEASQDYDHNLDPSYEPKIKPKNSSEGRKRKKSGTGGDSGTKKRCGGNAINHVEQFNWGDFDVTNELGYGRCGMVCEAMFRCEKVALKIADSWKYPQIEDELMNEANIYIF